MARIVGVDIPKEKRVVIALTYVYGIGPAVAKNILTEAGISFDKRAKELTDKEILDISKIIETRDIKTEGNLRQEIRQNIKRLMDINCYRGIRHKKGLPVRGQATKTNARTRKGPVKAQVTKKKAPGKK